MIEDMAAVELIDEIAAVAGVDLLAVGPSDLSRSLGVSGQPDHPKLVAAIDRVRAAVKKGAGARLALPLNHAAFPRNAAQLRDLAALIADAAVRSPQASRRLSCRFCEPDRAMTHYRPDEPARDAREGAMGA
jgi:2-keto-3-deoxy-L-rhamnonate aldolase RhmA